MLHETVLISSILLYNAYTRNLSRCTKMAQQETEGLLTHSLLAKNTDQFVTAVDENRTADKDCTYKCVAGV